MSDMYVNIGHHATLKGFTSCAKKLYGPEMSAVGPKLKALREATSPRLSVRAVAARLEMPASSYALYEDVNRYKKAYLPVPLARRIAAIFAEHDVSPAEVMTLAGLASDEAEPEGRAIEASKPHTQVAYMPVLLPSEAALVDMFRGLLAIVPSGASKDETAKILARRLPTGFAAIGFPAPGLVTARLPAADADPLSLAKSHPED